MKRSRPARFAPERASPKVTNALPDWRALWSSADCRDKWVVLQAYDGHNRRRYERVRLGGSALLIADPRRGLIGAKGRLIDLSEGGCRLQFRRRVYPRLAARVRLDLGGQALWFPVVTRWARSDPNGWTVGCAFGRLTPNKHHALQDVLLELSLERGRR